LGGEFALVTEANASASVGTQTEELDGDPSAYRILWDRAEKDTNLSASATPSASTDEGTETPTAADFAATARLVLSVLRVRRVFRERVARTRAQAEWDKMEDIEEGDEGEDKEDKDEKEKKKIQVMSDLDLGVKERATEMEPVEGTAPSLTDPMGVDTDRSGPAEVTEPAGKTELGEPTGLRGRTEDTEPTPTATRLLSKSFLLPLTAARRRALSMASLGSNLAAFMSTATLVDEPESILPSPSPSPSSPSSPMLSGSRSSTMRSSTASSFSEALTASVSTEFEFNGGASSATLFIEQADVQVQTEEYKVSFSHQGDEDGDGFARSIKGDCLDAANIKTTQTTRTITRLVLGGVQRVRKSDA
jgi:hypothetical protein